MINSKKKQMQKIVNDYFSLPEVVSYYSKFKLHNSEKILFKKYLKKRARVLDLFCGSGRASIPLAKIGYRVVGVDINPKLIQIAELNARKQSLQNVKFYCVDAEKMKFKKNSFDYILILENSLEHVPTRKKRQNIIKKIYKFIRSGGLVISSFNSSFYPIKLFLKVQRQNLLNIFTHEYESGDIILDRKFGRIYFHFFTPMEIFKLFLHNKFKLVSIEPWNILDKQNNRFPIIFYRYLWFLTYCFWVFKK
jgi:2-polyprenyl-3-methyl-5-hydroxy-6-metoxy-1,4-benzoquinol methylase